MGRHLADQCESLLVSLFRVLQVSSMTYPGFPFRHKCEIFFVLVGSQVGPTNLCSIRSSFKIGNSSKLVETIDSPNSENLTGPTVSLPSSCQFSVIVIDWILNFVLISKCFPPRHQNIFMSSQRTTDPGKAGWIMN